MTAFEAPADAGIILWGRATSSNTQKVSWLLNELEVPHLRRDAGGPFGKIDVALNPNRLVPVLEESDGWLLWESHAIARYVCETYVPASTWWPGDPRTRADISRWMDWQQTALHPLMRRLGAAVAEPGADEAALASLEKQTAEKWIIVAERLRDAPYVCGATPTLADMALGIGIHRRMAMPLSVPVPEPLVRWYHRLCERRPYREAVVKAG